MFYFICGPQNPLPSISASDQLVSALNDRVSSGGDRRDGEHGHAVGQLVMKRLLRQRILRHRQLESGEVCGKRSGFGGISTDGLDDAQKAAICRSRRAPRTGARPSDGRSWAAKMLMSPRLFFSANSWSARSPPVYASLAGSALYILNMSSASSSQEPLSKQLPVPLRVQTFSPLLTAYPARFEERLGLGIPSAFPRPQRVNMHRHALGGEAYRKVPTGYPRISSPSGSGCTQASAEKCPFLEFLHFRE